MKLPLLPSPTLVAGTDLQMLQTSCTVSTRPLTAWMMQSLNLQGQGLVLVLTVLLAEGRGGGEIANLSRADLEAESNLGNKARGARKS